MGKKKRIEDLRINLTEQEIQDLKDLIQITHRNSHITTRAKCLLFASGELPYPPAGYRDISNNIKRYQKFGFPDCLYAKGNKTNFPILREMHILRNQGLTYEDIAKLMEPKGIKMSRQHAFQIIKNTPFLKRWAEDIPLPQTDYKPFEFKPMEDNHEILPD